MINEDELWEEYAEPLPGIALEVGKGILYLGWYLAVTLFLIPGRIYRNYKQ